MGLLLEQGKIRLAHDRGIGVVHLLEEDVAAHGFILLLGQQLVGQHHLAEGGGGLGQRKGRVEGKRAVMGGQHGVDGVPELMGHGRHVAGAALVVQQHVGRHIWQHRPAEGAVAFPLAHLAVHVLLVEDALSHLSQLRVEGVERVEDHLRRIVVLELFI